MKTPESLSSGLNRKDSKHPLTTCFGLTTAGRACRRSLPAAVQRLNESTTDEDDDEQSTVATVVEETEFGSEIVAFYCWQHKDQAASYHTNKIKRVLTVRTRGSLEDMLSSMGLEDDRQVQMALKKQRRRRDEPQYSRTTVTASNPRGLPQKASPIEAQTVGSQHEYNERGQRQSSNATSNRHGQNRHHIKNRRESPNPSFWSVLCGCFEQPQSHGRNDRQVISRPIANGNVRPKQVTFSQSSPYASHRQPASNNPQQMRRALNDESRQRPSMQSSQSQPAIMRKPLASQAAAMHDRPASSDDRRNTGAGTLAAASEVIPKTASLALASALMAEMARISEDVREGYIYIYWLADANTSLTDDDGESLISSPDPVRRDARLPDGSRDKVLLKVGRAENVHRRLSQWGLQCGRKPLLVTSHPLPEQAIKARHLHRVERLIHIELRAQNVKVDCAECGREHREWFEVSGREGVREVDRVVRKWVGWANRQP